MMASTMSTCPGDVSDLWYANTFALEFQSIQIVAPAFIYFSFEFYLSSFSYWLGYCTTTGQMLKNFPDGRFPSISPSPASHFHHHQVDLCWSGRKKKPKNMANIWNLQVCSSSVCLPEDYNKMDLPPTEGPVIVNTTIILIDIFEVIVISKTSLGEHCLSFHTITIIAQPGPPWDLHPGPELVHQACLGRQ